MLCSGWDLIGTKCIIKAELLNTSSRGPVGRLTKGGGQANALPSSSRAQQEAQRGVIKCRPEHHMVQPDLPSAGVRYAQKQ